MGLMRFLFSISAFAVTMILALVAFTYTTVTYPETMHEFLAAAQHVKEYVQEYLPDKHKVWVDILLHPAQIVLIGFSIAMRIFIGILSSILWRGDAANATSSSSGSDTPFSRWR